MKIYDFVKGGRWLSKHLSFAIKHLPEKEELIFNVFKNCVVLLFLIKTRDTGIKISGAKHKWSIFLEKLSQNNNSDTLTQYCFNLLIGEITKKEKPFWTENYKQVSNKLYLPDTTWVKSIMKIHNTRKNETVLQHLGNACREAKSYHQPQEPAKFKTIKIKIYPTNNQKMRLDEWIDTARYVYNMAIEKIKSGHRVNFQLLRDMLVTDRTKKGYDEYLIRKKEIDLLNQKCNNGDEKKQLKEIIKEKYSVLRNQMKTFQYKKNPHINDWELNTSKDIRSNAVKQACDAYKSGFTNLKRGNIKYFNLSFKLKSDYKQTIELTPQNIKMKNGEIIILPQLLKSDSNFKIGNKNFKKYIDLKITKNTDLVREKGEYYLHVIVPTQIVSRDELLDSTKVCGVDPGIRTYATVHTHDDVRTQITEYFHDAGKLKKLNDKIDLLKEKRFKNCLKTRKKRIRKKWFNKLERYKINLVDGLHWGVINDLIKNNDVIFFGDIKSHDIVKDGKNKKLNRNFNDLKFYQLKQRLIYKAGLHGKLVHYVKEHYTTKTCSCCGKINDNIGCNKTFNCKSCGLITGRDWNAAKNIKMKGLMS